MNDTCKCGKFSSEEHTCPYQTDVNYNDEFKCNCCSECTRECADEV